MVTHILSRDPLFRMKYSHFSYDSGTTDTTTDINFKSISYSDDDETVVRCALSRFSHRHPHIVGVDKKMLYFDHNTVTQDVPYIRHSALDKITQLSSAGPSRHCNPKIDQDLFDTLLEGLILPVGSKEDGSIVNQTRLAELDSLVYIRFDIDSR